MQGKRRWEMGKIDKLISINMKKLREKSGYTQQDIADILECTRVNVVRMEKGLGGFTATTIFTLSCIFECTPSDLFPPIPKTKQKRLDIHKHQIKEALKGSPLK